MKIGIIRSCLIIGTLVSAHATSGQQFDIEKEFDKKKASYTLSRFSTDVEGATDNYFERFEYLYYRDKDQLVKLRIIEIASDSRSTSSIKVDDYFFLNGDLRLVRLYFFIGGNRLEAIRKGSIVPLITGENIEMDKGKLVRWSALGKEIPPTDRRWNDKQSSVLLSARVELITYEEFIKPKK